MIRRRESITGTEVRAAGVREHRVAGEVRPCAVSVRGKTHRASRASSPRRSPAASNPKTQPYLCVPVLSFLKAEFRVLQICVPSPVLGMAGTQEIFARMEEM